MDAVPNARALELGQDRLVEKELFRRLGIATAAFGSVEEVGLPALVKSRRFGYDGKGQRVVETTEAARRRRAGGGDRPVRPRAVDRRGAWRATARPRSTRSPRTSTAAESSPSRGLRHADAPQAAAERDRGEAARRPRLRRRARGRAVRRRRRAARERVCPARPQHRALDDRRRRDEPVREPPPRDPRAAARVDRCPG